MSWHLILGQTSQVSYEEICLEVEACASLGHRRLHLQYRYYSSIQLENIFKDGRHAYLEINWH